MKECSRCTKVNGVNVIYTRSQEVVFKLSVDRAGYRRAGSRTSSVSADYSVYAVLKVIGWLLVPCRQR